VGINIFFWGVWTNLCAFAEHAVIGTATSELVFTICHWKGKGEQKYKGDLEGHPNDEGVGRMIGECRVMGGEVTRLIGADLIQH
jgi:hypothetical protein